MQTIGQRVRALRERDHLSQTKLGEIIELTTSAVGAIEKNISKNPEKIKAIASHFEVDVNWILTGEGETPKGITTLSASDNPYKDALVSHLMKEVEFLRGLLQGNQSFLKPLTKKVRVHSGKVIKMFPAGAQVGGYTAQA